MLIFIYVGGVALCRSIAYFVCVFEGKVSLLLHCCIENQIVFL